MKLTLTTLAVVLVCYLLAQTCYFACETVAQREFCPETAARQSIPLSPEKNLAHAEEIEPRVAIADSKLVDLLVLPLFELTRLKNQGDAETKAVLEQIPAGCLSNLPGLSSNPNAVIQTAFQEPTSPNPVRGLPQEKTEAAENFGNPNTVANPIPKANEPNGKPVWNPHPQAMNSVPSDAGEICDDPHANVFSQTDYPSAQECAACHKQIFDEWAVSSHAYAGVSPMFHVFEDTINRLTQGTIGYFCLRCHAPVATTMGLRRDQPIWDGPKVFREGVTCVVCHRVKSNYTRANGERRVEPGSSLEPVYGPGSGIGVETTIKYSDFYKVKTQENQPTGQNIHRRAIQFEELSEATFCASCHQVAVQPGVKLEVVWDQYRASPAWREGITCQDCHMGKVPGRAEGYAVGPAAIVNDKVVNAERKHSNHMFFGPGYPITHPGIFPQTAEADRWSFNEWLLFDWQAGWGTKEFEEALAQENVGSYFPSVWQSADDRFDAREIIDKNISRLSYKKDIRRQVLENGSKLDGPFFTKNPLAGAPLSFYYCVTNTNNGHNLPSGSLGAQPQVWLNAVLIGPDGERIWESGYLDSDGDLADNQSRDVLNNRIPLDKQLFNLQTKFLITNVKGTDREMNLPINVDVDQLPFIRPAPQPVTTLNHPPGIRMENHSLPPNGERKAKFVVPSSVMQHPGTYRLTIRMRSRSHPPNFMRYCGATPEMMKAMNQETVDFHLQSSLFEVQ